MSLREKIYHKKYWNQVVHTTFNPAGPGVVRVHMVPPKFRIFHTKPAVVIVNGKDIIPINVSWAILFTEFVHQMNGHGENEVNDETLKNIVDETIHHVRRIYPKVNENTLKEDLWTIVDTLSMIAYGKTPEEEIGYMSIGEYAPFMKAPHRMDLMISSMEKDNHWNCNQKCIHCYAADQELANLKELSTNEWKEVIDKCKQIGIPQLTFTGGEPTLREDLCELISHARWFVTRLNTNGVLLTKDLCENLYKAELDSVQITLYSDSAHIHNQLVGAPNYYKTIEGIKNALAAGLNISVNTPICSINKDYVKTLELLNQMGIKYVSCSGLIVAGNGAKETSRSTSLKEEELYDILSFSVQYCNKNNMEISFTSPGWLVEEQLTRLGLDIPSCGACLSNMAVAPNGYVIPCQSWLSSDSQLGSILERPWKHIWNHPNCKKQRLFSSKMKQICPLKGTQI